MAWRGGTAWIGASVTCVILNWTPVEGAAQTPGLPPAALRQAAHGRALGAIGGSGLRGLLSASGVMGDLQNRAASYRMAAHLEGARIAAVEGRIQTLEAALENASLGPAERAALTDLRDRAVDELSRVPSYEASYRTATTQVEALMPFGFVGDRPLFLLVRGRSHLRGGGEDRLTVLSEAASAGPVLMLSDSWVASAALALARTDATVGAFDGWSDASSVGPRIDVGGMMGSGWSMAAQIAHSWARTESKIVRPDGAGGTDVRSEAWSGATSVRGEIHGRFPLTPAGAAPWALLPRVGGFLISTHTPATTNSLGERGTGRFGPRESVAAVRVGAGVEGQVGPVEPSAYLGWEWERARKMARLVDDPNAVQGVLGLGWSWTRGRRVQLEGTLSRGLAGRRTVSELTLVVILDG